jgi:hypothetical protein
MGTDIARQYVGSPASREIGPCTGTGNPTWEDARHYAHLGVLYGTPIRSGDKVVPNGQGRERGCSCCVALCIVIIVVVIVVVICRRYL